LFGVPTGDRSLPDGHTLDYYPAMTDVDLSQNNRVHCIWQGFYVASLAAGYRVSIQHVEDIRTYQLSGDLVGVMFSRVNPELPVRTIIRVCSFNFADYPNDDTVSVASRAVSTGDFGPNPEAPKKAIPCTILRELMSVVPKADNILEMRRAAVREVMNQLPAFDTIAR